MGYMYHAFSPTFHENIIISLKYRHMYESNYVGHRYSWCFPLLSHWLTEIATFKSVPTLHSSQDLPSIIRSWCTGVKSDFGENTIIHTPMPHRKQLILWIEDSTTNGVLFGPCQIRGVRTLHIYLLDVRGAWFVIHEAVKILLLAGDLQDTNEANTKW